MDSGLSDVEDDSIVASQYIRQCRRYPRAIGTIYIQLNNFLFFFHSIRFVFQRKNQCQCDANLQCFVNLYLHFQL